MEELNNLINCALKTKDEDYVTPEGIKRCSDFLEKSSKTDNVALKIYLYFFPVYYPLEKNKEFWFTKYKDLKEYNEYEFAKDLLKCYIEYFSDKNEKSFELKLLEKVKLFKNSKYIATFSSVVKEFEERIIAIISYITKDPSYFESAFELIASPENIQTITSIKEISSYLKHKKTLLDLQRSLEMVKKYRTEFENVKKDSLDLGKRIDGLSNENIALKKELRNLSQDINELKIKDFRLENKVKKLEEEKVDNIKLKGEMDEMKQKMEKMDERLQLIDLRDTVKMSLRYIYKVLYSKFPYDMKDVSNILDQINEVGKILSQPRFKRFELISRFVTPITFGKLVSLNHITHDSTQPERNFQSIKKYLQSESDDDL